MAALPPPRTAADYAAASALFCLNRAPTTFAFYTTTAPPKFHTGQTPTNFYLNRILPPLPTTYTATPLIKFYLSRTLPPLPTTHAPHPPFTAPAFAYAYGPVSFPPPHHHLIEAARTLYDLATAQPPTAATENTRNKIHEIDDEGYATEDDDNDAAGGRNRGKVFREHTPEGQGWEEEVWLQLGDAGEEEGEREGDGDEEEKGEGEGEYGGEGTRAREVEREDEGEGGREEACLQQGKGEGKRKRESYPTPSRTGSEQTVEAAAVVTKYGRQSKRPKRWGG